MSFGGAWRGQVPSNLAMVFFLFLFEGLLQGTSRTWLLIKGAAAAALVCYPFVVPSRFWTSSWCFIVLVEEHWPSVVCVLVSRLQNAV